MTNCVLGRSGESRAELTPNWSARLSTAHPGWRVECHRTHARADLSDGDFYIAGPRVMTNAVQEQL